jgi:argininosuccinate lyase
MQEDKEMAFDAMETVQNCLLLFTGMIQTMKFRKDKMAKSALGGFTNATDAADYLVNKGVPFRDAYREVGMSVQNGTYQHDGRELNHTHEGSIGNLCLDNIKAKFERNMFDYSAVQQAEAELMK